MEVNNNRKAVDMFDGKLQWTGAMTTLLLSEVKYHEEKFNLQPHKIIWKEICGVLNEYGYNITTDQCCSKWKSLKRKYMQIKDNNNHTGAANEEWIYYKQMDDILKTRPEVNPLSLASSSNGFRVRKITPSTDNNIMADNENTNYETVVSPRNRGGISKFVHTPARSRKSHSQFEPYWAQALREQRERHHKETYAQRERFISICEEMLKQ